MTADAFRHLTEYERGALRRATPWFASVVDPVRGERRESEAVGEKGAVVVLCMTPRSGSTALSATLAATGVLGRGGERLNRKPGGELERFVAGRRFASRRALLEAVFDASRTPNGVGQIKVDLAHLLPFLVDPEARLALRRARFVYLTRERVLAQAVSRYRGFQTGRWHALDEAETAREETAYDFTEIRRQIFFLANMMAGYERAFATLDVRPLRLSYEEILADEAGAVARIAAHAGVALPRRYDLGASGHRVVRTTNDDALQRLFLADFASAAAGRVDASARAAETGRMSEYPKSALTALTSFERNILSDAGAWFEKAGLNGGDEPPPSSWEDEKLLMLCMTPRSGSSALSAAMTTTGVMGRGGERLNRKSGGPLEKLLSENSFASRAQLLDEAIRRSRTPNGVGHVKCDFAQIYPFLMDPACRPRLVRARFVYLTREDVLGQAVSRFRGSRSGFWHSTDGQEASPDVEYDFDGIRAQILYLAEMTAAYERVFAAFDIRPLRITYESVVADTPGVVARIAAHLDVALDREVTLEDSGHERVATDNNAILRERFVSDVAALLDTHPA